MRKAAKPVAPILTAGYTRMSKPLSSVEEVIRAKIVEKFQPTRLQIHNDSHLHAHHAAMADSKSKETHFRLVVTSSEFAGKRAPARHRMVYALLADELSRKDGVHALQLSTLTPEEDPEAPDVVPEPVVGEEAEGVTEVAAEAGKTGDAPPAPAQ